MTDTIIDLIRHGEPVGGRLYRGHKIDDPLSDKGWQQMSQAVGMSAPWTHIVSSPLIRCRAFAETLAGEHGIPMTIDTRLQEVGFGDWEGKSPDELKRECLHDYEAFYADPLNNRPSGAEPLEQFIGRVTSAYTEIARHYRGQHILLVTHAGVMRAVIAHILCAGPLGMYRIKVHNAGITRIISTPNGDMLEYHNHILNAQDS